MSTEKDEWGRRRREPSVYAQPGLELQESEAPGPEHEKKKRGGRKGVALHVLLIFVLVILFLFGAAFAVIYYSASRTDYEPYREFAEDPEWRLPEKGEEGVTNILLIGTDGRNKTEESRSDTIVLCSICPRQKKICLTSILRDSYVTIPDYGMNRINHAYQMGGARLLIETIEMNFHVRIDNYVKVDFFSFVDIVDALGGVTVDVLDEEVHYLNAYLCDVNLLTGRPAEEDFLASGGTYRLTGRQALAYSRIRYIGTDFGRTERQRTVLQAAFREVKKKPFKAVTAAYGVLPELVTDLTELEITGMVLRLPVYSGYEIVSDHIPYDHMWQNAEMPNGQEVLAIDLPAVTAELQRRLYLNRR
ncbi:MAG: LCP family protein [Lachnospiraceae bacterium]|nr:LCP family protein [Lachnospiraceae bacterium]